MSTESCKYCTQPITLDYSNGHYHANGDYVCPVESFGIHYETDRKAER